ncbi:hypothetical protein [Marinobacter goseongensis]|uniref:hypothetical protein n=1 Tax=Marinobacter goseongensis TaxID=453838 RepID=UPI0020050191|nr:hypothetical protein [Marinobacter goseongensis]MCK7552783.1 hypothetical protein [Marinobacter goseongensis]
MATLSGFEDFIHDHAQVRIDGKESIGFVTVLPMVYQEVLAPRRGRTPGMQLDVDRVFDQLDQAKVRQHDTLSVYAQARALKAVRGEMRLVVWREVPIRWQSIELDGQHVRLPDCIERHGRMWVMAWPCPDGSHFRARRPVSADPEADLAALIHDGLRAAARVTVRPARGLFDTV